MGIINSSYENGSHTKLNKLRYGDTPSISTEPIIQKRIPSTLDSKVPRTNEGSRRIDDLKRIATILTQKPGLKYLANETALNAAKVTPKRNNNKTLAGNILSGIGANLFNSIKIIGSTLAQVPLNGTGTHFVKGFAGKGKGTYLRNLDQAPHQLVRGGSTVFPDEIMSVNLNVDPHPYDQVSPKTKDTETTGGQKLDMSTGLVGTEDKSIFAMPFPDLHYPVQRDVKKENRILLGNPSARKIRGYTSVYYSTQNEDAIDKINTLAPYTSGSVNEKHKDLIKFRFEVVTSGQESTFLHFRAFLDQFDDSFTGNWDTINYVGRGENFYNYSTFNRAINIGFKISAQTRAEMKPLYQKMVRLAGATAPTYSSFGYMKGTFVKVTMGDYLDQMPCILQTVTYTWQNEYQWEIAMGKTEDRDMQELPMTLDCAVSLIPLHTFTPQAKPLPYFTNMTSTVPGKQYIETQGNE